MNGGDCSWSWRPGAAKTSLNGQGLLERDAEAAGLRLVYDAPKRPNEVDGRDYHFVDRERFQQMVRDEGFLEHAAVFDKLLRHQPGALQDAFGAGFDVVLEIDWQGARQVRSKVPECISVFILPPSRQALEQRLRDRRTDSPEVIARRLRDADRHGATTASSTAWSSTTTSRRRSATCGGSCRGTRGRSAEKAGRPTAPGAAPLLDDLLA